VTKSRVDEDESWRESARCRGLSDIMYPENHNIRAVQLAKSICAECPVREQCLDYALRYNESHGIWGGMGERQRRAARYQRNLVRPRAVKCGTRGGYDEHRRLGTETCAACRAAQLERKHSYLTRPE